MSTLHSKFAPIVICLAFGFAACGDDSSGYGNDATTPAYDDNDEGGYDYGSPSTDAAGPGSGFEVEVVVTTSGLGEIVTDAGGNALYMFASDPADTATCTGGCASTWPPLLAADLTVGAGLDASLFTTVSGEGGEQVSFNGHPLYFFSGDTAPGDTNGQGSGGVWFVVGPDGNPITD